MRLEPAEVAKLPLAAALLDADGRSLAATPEWKGAGPGACVYLTGHGHLVVAPDVPTPELDGLVDCLLSGLERARADLDSEAAMRVEVLACGLRLVAGRPPGDPGPTGAGRVLELARAAIAARTQGLAVEVCAPTPDVAVPCPGAVALAARNPARRASPSRWSSAGSHGARGTPARSGCVPHCSACDGSGRGA